jgi:hypothetical protein
MPLTDEELTKLFLLLRRPIVWDPAPTWLKLKGDVAAKFVEAQTRWNAKLAEIDRQKVAELGKIAGMKLGV